MRWYISSVFGVGLFVVFNSAFAFQESKYNSSTPHLTSLQQMNAALNLVSFALKFTQVLYNETKNRNVFFSPVSMYSSLSTAHLGSSGVTRQELAQLIGFPKDDETSAQMHQIFGELMRSAQASDTATARLANGVFLQKSLHLKEQYSRELKKYYGNEVSIVDFSGGSTATKYINKWISDKTGGHISKLFQRDLLDSTHMVMANAFHFSAKWEYAFGNESTVVEKFDTGFDEVDVPMMQNQKQLYYLNYQPASFHAIALPYEKYEFVMYLAVPYANQTLKNMLDFLTVENLTIAMRQCQNKAYVDYKIPRMKFQKTLSMKEALKKMGLENFFEKGEFNYIINSTTYLNVSDVTQGVEMDINEGAISAITGSTQILDTYFVEDTPSHDEPVKFYLNRPFIFFINHERTNTVMFSAVVHNPLD